MKKVLIFTTIFTLILGGIFYSCEEKTPEIPFLTVDETPVTAKVETGNYSIAVSSNGEWTAIVEDATSHAWCTLTNASGNGNGTITVNVTENLLLTARNATVKITFGNLTKSVKFTQAAVEPFLAVDETPVTAKVETGTYSIAVSSNGEWTAIVEDANSHNWCTLTNASGNGNGTITVNVTENLLLTARNATVKITFGNLTKSVLLTQDAAKPFLTVDETPIFASAEAGTYSIAVGCNGEWTATVEDAANHAWCTLTNAFGNGNGIITVNVAENTTATARNATVKITSGSLVKSVVINQETDIVTIIGKWKLVKVTIPMMNVSYDYSNYNIVYEFKPDNILTVSGETADIEIYRGHAIGEHYYSITEYTLKIGNSTFWYLYHINFNELIIDGSPFDAFIYNFVRIK